MAPGSDPLTYKESFLQENQLFAEIKLSDESKPIGKLHEFDNQEDEFWLLQCPKGMDVSELQNQKLKIPGRTNIVTSEAISMEFTEGKEQHAFAYCNRKGRYALRLLPVRGTIVIRDRLKAAESVTTECAEKYCPLAKRVPLPTNIRVRHPLLGAQYKDRIELDKSILERLHKADKVSAEILKGSLSKKSKSILAQNLVPSPEINSADDGVDVEFIRKEKLKKKKNKRKYSESSAEAHTSAKNKTTKISKMSEEFVSKDLQWLQNI